MKPETQAAMQQWLEGECVQYRVRDNFPPRAWTELLPADNKYCNNIQFYDSNEYRLKPKNIVLYRLVLTRLHLTGASDCANSTSCTIHRSIDSVLDDLATADSQYWVCHALEELSYDRDTLRLTSTKSLPQPNRN